MTMKTKMPMLPIMIACALTLVCSPPLSGDIRVVPDRQCPRIKSGSRGSSVRSILLPRSHSWIAANAELTTLAIEISATRWYRDGATQNPFRRSILNQAEAVIPCQTRS